MQIDYTDTNILYNIGIALLIAVSSNKDLGFINNSTLKTSSHITSIITKANAI